MSSKKWYPFEEWNDQQHQLFYQKLKGATREERSAAIISQASLLLEKFAGNADTLKAAESLLGFWLLHVNYSPHTSAARDLLCRVYLKMDQPEKAKAFSPDL